MPRKKEGDEMERYWKDGCKAAPEWIIDDEVVAIISDCTGCLNSDVENVLQCYCMLLKEAALEGFKIPILGVGYLHNRPTTHKISFGKNKGELLEYSEPAFKFLNSFKKEMRERTRGYPYDFREQGGYSWKTSALEELGGTGTES